MEYTRTLDYLFTQLPVYQRDGPAAYKPDLSKTIALMKMVGNPERDLKCVHVAGTNGKGSVSSMIAAVLQTEGYKVGLYTSPHLKDFRERIRINGQKIPQEFVVDFVAKHKENWSELQPSFFEITVAMAFRYFQDEGVDIAVIEVGLGGRLDSTNVVTPEVSVITNIGLDHTQFLGETIEEIAAEKGGIIKSGIPVVLGRMVDGAREVLVNIATLPVRGPQGKLSQGSVGVSAFGEPHPEPVEGYGGWSPAPVIDASQIEDQLPTSDLTGRYQKENRQTALAALKVLKGKGWALTFDSVIKGLEQVQQLTGIQGRWQQLGSKPIIIVDCAHNADGMAQAMEQLAAYRYSALHIVLGIVGDKNADALLAQLPRAATYYFTQANIPRAMEPEVLAEKAAAVGLRGETFESVSRAYSAARLYAEEDDLIFIGGSVFVVAEVV